MSDAVVIPALAECYGGPKHLLEHLSILVRWAKQHGENLPPILLTGARSRRMEVLSALVAEYLSIPMWHICAINDRRKVDLELITNGKIQEFESFEQFLGESTIHGLLFLERDDDFLFFGPDKDVRDRVA